MKLTTCLFSLLVIKFVYNEPPSWVTCNNVIGVFAGSPEKWTCERGGKALGSGSSGITYVLKNKDGMKAVSKVMYYDKDDPTDSAATEIKYLKKLKGLPNIVDFYDYSLVRTKKGNIAIIIQEFAEQGSLFDFFLDNRDYFANPRATAKMMAGIANGVKQMHLKQLVHADLKLENIVVAAGNVPKLIDFDLSNEIDKSGDLKGTPDYIDPKLYNSAVKMFTEKVDVYSLGVVYYILSTGKFPFHGKTVDDVKASIASGLIYIEKNMDLTVAKLITSCLQVDPTRRPTMNKLITQIDAYLRSTQDKLVDAIILSNKRNPNANEFRVLSTIDRSAESQNYISTGEIRLLSQEKEEAQAEWIFPLVLAVSSILMFLVFRAVSTWVDNLRHQTKVSQVETSAVGVSTVGGDLTIAMESGAH